MRQYTYEFELFECGGAWCAFPFGLAGATGGSTRAEAIENAADWLYIMAEDAEIWDAKLPDPVFDAPLEHGGERLVVSVTAGRELVETVRVSQAAKLLGVSVAQAVQLLESKELEGRIETGDTYITVNSIAARLSEPNFVEGALEVEEGTSAPSLKARGILEGKAPHASREEERRAYEDALEQRYAEDAE